MKNLFFKKNILEEFCVVAKNNFQLKSKFKNSIKSIQ
jgi:hypothetical protein